MLMNRVRRFVLIGGLTISQAVCGAPGESSSTPTGERTNSLGAHLWKPVPDAEYLQEVGQKILTTKPLTGAAVLKDTLYVIEDGTIKRLVGGVLEQAPGAPDHVLRLKAVAGALWASTSAGTYRLQSNSWQNVDSRSFEDFCLHLGKVYAATRDDIFRFESDRFVNIRPADGYLSNDDTVMTEKFEQVLVEPVQLGPIQRLASYSGTLYMLRPRGLALLQGRTFMPDPIDWGMLPSPFTVDLLA